MRAIRRQASGWGTTYGLWMTTLGLLWLTGLARPAAGQSLSFGNHREIQPPDYALLRIGPFYSSLTFSQSVGYRYVSTKGTGADYLFGNYRGVYLKDGSEFPLTTQLDSRNYVILGRNADMDISVRARYSYYPLKTQENDFFLGLTDEQISGSYSTELQWTPYLRTSLYDTMTYLTDYIDARGLDDRYGGTQYRLFSNVLGTETDWLMSKRQNTRFLLARSDYIPTEDGFELHERYAYDESLVYELQVIGGLVVGGSGWARQVNYKSTARQDVNLQGVYLFAGYGQAGEKGADLPVSPASTVRLSLGYAGAAAATAGQGLPQRPANSDELSDPNSTPWQEDTDTHVSLVGEASLRTQLNKQLSHQLFYRKELREGYLWVDELVDTYGYTLDWAGELASAQLFTRKSIVDISREDWPDYEDWSTGGSVNYPLTRIIILHGSSVYSIRENEVLVAPLDDPGFNGEYTTWVTELGTAFQLTKKLRTDAYYQHIERNGDDERNDFERDVVGVNLTYSHTF